MSLSTGNSSSAAITGATCSSKRKKSAIEITVIDLDSNPFFDIGVELKNNNNQSLKNRTDRNGFIRFEGIEKGDYQLSLYKTDGKLWDVQNSENLSEDRKASRGCAPWEPSKEYQAKSKKHVALYDECITSIAAHYGFSPQTLWDLPENNSLKKKRPNMNILQEGDEVFIPERSIKWETVQAERCVTIKLSGIQSFLNLQLLDTDRNSRPDTDYLLSITAKSGKVFPDKKGTSDREGFINEPVPPDVDTATIVVMKDGIEDRYDLKLGGLDPFETLRGKQQRLRNLGFYCEYETTIGESTQEAVKQFQERYSHDVTGELEAIAEKLKEVCMC
jgi:hypothetical protein